jgi:F-type H+/Na+-transporting ATPase subunit alpha
VLEKIAGGDWSDETQKALDDAISQYARDFGYDLDEEGQPLTDEQAIEEGGGRQEREDESAGDDEEGSGDRDAAVAAGTSS